MNDSSVNNGGTHFTSISAAMLVATLAALLALFVLAKPSGAQETTVTVKPSDVGFGAVELTANPETRTVTIKNNGTTDLVIGGVDISGTNASDFSLATTIDPLNGLTVRAGEAATLDINFDPATEGVKNAVLTLEDLTGNPLANVAQVNVTGTGVTAQPAAPADCTIVGTNNGETLTGTPADDVICALGGNDRVDGLGGGDTVRGGSGKDRIVDPTTGDADKLFGEGGKDRINSKDRDGNDTVNGGPKRDKIKKNKGDQGKMK